jgi:hypothetical protein
LIVNIIWRLALPTCAHFVALKELRESERWLKLIQKTNLLTRQDALPHVLDETTN